MASPRDLLQKNAPGRWLITVHCCECKNCHERARMEARQRRGMMSFEGLQRVSRYGERHKSGTNLRIYKDFCFFSFSVSFEERDGKKSSLEDFHNRKTKQMTWVNGLLFGIFHLFRFGVCENLSFHLQLHIASCAKKGAAGPGGGWECLSEWDYWSPEAMLAITMSSGQCMFFENL